MSTLNQLVYNYPRLPKKKKIRTPLLVKNPQRKGICFLVKIVSPKKPNSGRRKVAKLTLSTRKQLLCSIPGESSTLQKHHSVLFRGGHVRDIPGMKYKCIPGVYDFKAVRRTTRRSKYGTSQLMYHAFKQELLNS